MPYRVKVYLIFWLVLIVVIPLVILYRKFHPNQCNSEENITFASVENMSEREPFINRIKFIFKKIFSAFMFFLIGLIIVYYNFFGLGDVFFSCGRHNSECRMNALKKGMKEGYSKPSDPTFKDKPTGRKVSKIVKKNKH